MPSPSSLALCAAIKRKDRLEIQRMLEAGADINELNLDQESAMHVAAYEGDVETMTAMIKRFARVNCRDASGKTPLHVAAVRGHLKVCELLLFYKAEANPTDKLGNTPLREANRDNRKEIAALLRSRMSQGYWHKLKSMFIKLAHGKAGRF